MTKVKEIEAGLIIIVLRFDVVELRVVPDGNCGAENQFAPGGWDGMVGVLLRKVSREGVDGIALTARNSVCALFVHRCQRRLTGSGHCHSAPDDNSGARTCHRLYEALHVAGHIHYDQETGEADTWRL